MQIKNTQVPRLAAHRRRLSALLASLACVAIALVAPAFASAAPPPIEINSLSDAPQETPGTTCDTGAAAGENCTLRAAIEAANFDPEFSLVEFSSSVFEGGQQIVLGSALPAIVHPLRMYSSLIDFGAYSGPAVGVTAPSGAAALTVKSDGVAIEQVAFGGGKAGIEVLNESTGFVAKGNWFGLNVINTPAAIQNAGIVLGPGSDEAKIGESDEAARNVFTHAPYGIYLEGASHAEVLGNYIGVTPTGTAVAGISNGVRIVDTSTSPAEDNVIGGPRTSAPGTADCGGGCNAIVASGLGVDLHGEVSENLGSAAGPTTIKGNYIDLAADGTELAQVVGVFGIYADGPTGPSPPTMGPGDLTVGGSTPAEANVIDSGQYGMVAEGAEGLLVQGNLIGWLPASGSPGSEPEGAALVVADEGVADLPEVVDNEIHLGPNPIGIESFGPGAVIAGNSIYGSRIGVVVDEDDAGVGNLIAENLIEDPILDGVLIENDANTVTGNTIRGAGRSGILLDRQEAPEPWPMSNRIGGDSPDQENLIEGSEESAISVGGEPETTNEVLGNFGSANGGPFILLREHSTGHPPNGEIKPPTLEVVQQSTVSGTAIAGAKVRLFGKPSTDPGSLERQIGSATADASGHWTATLATKLMIGKLLAATQTTAAGTPTGATSEVSAPKAAEADPVVPVTPEQETSGGGSSTSSSAASTPVTTTAPRPNAPKVKITKGPKKTSEATKVTFKYKVETAAGAKFECKLDGAKWAKCISPKTYKKLKAGKHTFRVRATANGLTSTVAKYQFTIKV